MIAKRLAAVLFASLIYLGLSETRLFAAPLAPGDSQVTPIEKLNVKIGVQYRIMYNGSNIPLAGVTTFADTKSNDFFRQRMRFNLDIQPHEQVGGYMQLEYRGGWGGTSPESSDPRQAGLTLNAFNRLEARGMRYGYVYYTPEEHPVLNTFAAGIIPVSDQLGDTQFSADWDFNVGGATLLGELDSLDYRLAYVRLVDGIASSDSSVVNDNGEFLIADANYALNENAKIGGHLYFLFGSEDLAEELGLGEGDVTQGWYAMSGSLDYEAVDVNAFAVLNHGDFGGADNTGWAFKLETVIPLGSPTLKLLGVYSTGDPEDETPNNQFRTIQGIMGTQGYWAYTHLFTANGPSDVNDLGVSLDNNGRGLISAQATIEIPVLEKLTAHVFSGWFSAAESNTDGNKNMGYEIGSMFTVEIVEYLNLDLGFAYAFMGNFFREEGRDPDDLYQGFGRLQLQF